MPAACLAAHSCAYPAQEEESLWLAAITTIMIIIVIIIKRKVFGLRRQ